MKPLAEQEPDPLRREENRNLALFAMLCFSLLLGLVLLAALDEEEVKQGPPPKLSVVRAYAYHLGETDEGHNFQLLILLTNHEETPAENVRIEVASKDPDTEITYDKSNLSGFSIPLENDPLEESTVERIVPFSVDAKVSRYRMEVVIFLDDVWQIKGELVTSPTKSYGVSEWSVSDTRGQVSVFTNRENGSNAALAFFFGLLLVTQLVVSLFYIRLKPLASGLRKILPFSGEKADTEEGQDSEG